MARTTTSHTSRSKRSVRPRVRSAVAIVKRDTITSPSIHTIPDYPSRKWSFVSRLAAVTLILFFVFVPVSDAFADTSDVPVELPAQEPVQVEEDAVVEISESAPETPEQTPEEVVDPIESEPVASTDMATDDVPSDTVVDETTSSVPPEEVVVENEPTVDVPDEPIQTTETETDAPLGTSTESTPSEGQGDTPAPDTETGSSTPEIIPEVVPVPVPVTPEPPATTTPVVEPEQPTPTTTPIVPTDTPEVMPETSTHTTDADRFTFGVSECVPVGNGAFHCVRTDERTSVQEAQEPLYAAKDADGDMEIYQNDGSTDRPLTQNNYDDDAPSMDAVTGDIVWHAQIDDRYQIMHYDAETGATTRITKEAYNSMQPAMNDGDIVFQAWIGDDWEIVLIDDADGREILTDNTEHDITPSITSDFIMWQAMEGGEWVGKIYDRRSQEIETVRGIQGGKVENPRMIMVFDSTKDNGDTETLGYDPVSGEVVSLAVSPVPVVPERIPDPEPQQEEKALVQPTTTTRTETKNATSTDTGSSDPNLDTASSTPQTEPTIDVTPVPAATSTEQGLTLDLNTAVVPPSVQESIPDLVIPAFNASSDATTSPSV